MNKKRSVFAIIATMLFSLSLFSASSFASVAYIGDKVAAKAVNRLEGKTLGKLDIDSLTRESYRSASIIGYRDWLPAAVQSIDANPVQMIILSLGMNDMQASNHDFPDNEALDAAIREILDNTTPRASVYWVLPHEMAASKEAHHPDQRTAIIQAIARAKRSGLYPRLFLVNVDAMAKFYDLNMSEMLNTNKVYMTNTGADIAAEHVIAFGNLMKLFE